MNAPIATVRATCGHLPELWVSSSAATPHHGCDRHRDTSAGSAGQERRAPARAVVRLHGHRGPAAGRPAHIDRVVEAGADGRGRECLIDGACGDGLSVAQQQGVAGAGGQILQVVGHQNRCERGYFGAQQVDAGEQLLAGGQVEAGGRFVEQ